MILDGKKIAEERNLVLKLQIEHDIIKYQRAPGLAIIMIGNQPASMSYVKGKIKACETVGIFHKLIHLEETISESDLVKQIESLNRDETIDGMILQLPIPAHLDEGQLIDLISKDKDADGFHVINQGYLYQKKAGIQPATPKGIMSLLEAYGIIVSGMDAVIIGRSNIVGFPVARLLMDQGATITVCHRKTKDLKAHTSKADLLVVASGKPNLVTRDMVKPGVIIIDVGVNRVDGKLVGDVDFESLEGIASYITPVPKGVGPMTINALLENTYSLYLLHNKS
jgi:methylenetetrahydrofolate dehydrogenase (NADP+)/methenyltetrahydrofolate cyclohydrolase